MANITKPLYESPQKERNNDLYGEHGSECICCGKPMAAGDALFVHMNTNWEAVSPSIKDDDVSIETGYNSQGSYPIGNSCAKKMKGFTSKGVLHKSHPKFKSSH